MHEEDDIAEGIISTMDALSGRSTEAAQSKYALIFSFRQELIDEVPEDFVASVERRFTVQINYDAEEDVESPSEGRSITFIGPLPNLYAAHLMLLQKVTQLEKDKKVEEERRRLEAEIAKAKKSLAQGTIIGRRRSQ
mmetsp:Transcript_145487/g.251901  ORF Transcript_145487/g.251901 Transcript_145487/m.251901 type:complete len:137 (+) Transcript_145487:3-413(+)